MTRAEFLRCLFGLAPAMLAPRWVFAQGDAVRTRIADLIKIYDAQGIHRTATPVDNASADWLRRMTTVAGAESQLVSFPLDRVDVRAAYVDINGQRIEGLPFFDGGFTGETGIVGRFGLPDSGADIVLVTLDEAAISSEGQRIAELRKNPAVRAIVGITAGASPGLSPSNAVAFVRPYGAPVLQVGSEHQAALKEQAARGTSATFVASAARDDTTALNVVATVAGRTATLPPLVVMTPRSGWWQCASERGGGLACWMEAIRAVAAAKPARRAIFIASSGHELGHLGLDRFLAQHDGLIKDAAAWIHLGANIGAAGGATRLQASDDQIEQMASRALEASGATVRQRVPRGTVPAGEARNIHVGGGRYVSLLGNGPHFHNQSDRFPDAVDVDAVTRYARAISALAVELTRT